MPALDLETLRLLQERGLVTPETVALSQPAPIAEDPIGAFEAPLDQGGVPAPAPEMAVDTVDLLAGAPPAISDPRLMQMPQGLITEPATPTGDIPSDNLDFTEPAVINGGQPPVVPVPPPVQPQPGDVAGALAGQRGTLQQAQELAVQQAAMEQQAAEQRSAASQQRFAELDQVMAKRDADIKAAMEETKKEYQTFKKMGIKDYWADKSTGNKLLAALAIGLGGFGGGTNQALQVINNAVNQDFKKQKAAIDKQFQIYQKSGQNVDTLNDFYANRVRSLSLKKAASLEKLKDELESKVSALGSEKARVQADQLIGRLDVDIAKAQQDAIKQAQNYALKKQLAEQKKKMQLDKPLSQVQSNAAGFSERMIQAQQAFTDLEAAGFDPAGIAAGIGRGLIPDVMRSDLALAQDQAEKNFLTAVLRKESGAAISEGELATGSKQYFPRAGDGERTLAQKTQNRKTALKAMMQAAGRGARQIQKEPEKPKKPKFYNKMTPRDKQAFDYFLGNPDHENASDSLELLRSKYGGE